MLIVTILETERTPLSQGHLAFTYIVNLTLTRLALSVLFLLLFYAK